MSTATVDAPTIKFKLLHGRCYMGKGENARTYQAQRDPVTKEMVCPIIETTKSLDKLFNSPGRPPKFERMTEIEAPEPYNPLERQSGETVQEFTQRLGQLVASAQKSLTSQLANVDKMTKEQLDQFAADEEIDTKGAKTIETMRATVKAAIKGS